MAEIINLRRARKAKDRAGKDADAAENRVRFGLSKAERRLGAAREDQAARTLEGHRLKGDDGEDA